MREIRDGSTHIDYHSLTKVVIYIVRRDAMNQLKVLAGFVTVFRNNLGCSYPEGRRTKI
jgi:hypothetical protein